MKIIQVITLSFIMMVTAVTVALGQEQLPATSGDSQMGTLPGSGEDRMLRLFEDFKDVASQINEAIASIAKAGTEKKKKAFDKLNEGQSLVREMLSKVKLLEKRQAKLPSYNTDANLSPEQRRVLIEGEQEIIARLEKMKTDMSNVRVNLENLDQKLAQNRAYLELLFDH